ncbi:MAG TPA: CZB domain-containing protein [Holophagaceae bacterium]|nr:CZB domain-containing protein [Holophagaceae bacterium]
MDFEEAMAAHRKWKSHLRLHIDGSSTDRMEPDLIGRDDLCDLGRWIHGEGAATMAAKPEFRTMRGAHARFHQVAAEVLRKSKEGDRHGACLALDGPFYRASVEVMDALEACKGACVPEAEAPRPRA